MFAVGLSLTEPMNRVPSGAFDCKTEQLLITPLKLIACPYGVQLVEQFFVILTHGCKTVKPKLCPAVPLAVKF